MTATGVAVLLERGRCRRDGRAIADPDDRTGSQGRPQDLGGEATDHSPGQVLGPGDGRREMDGVEPEPSDEGGGRRALDRGPIDDPDLDDPLGTGALEQPRDLRPGDPELFGDRVLRLTQLVIEPAGPHQLLEIAHGTDVLNRCACMPTHHPGDGRRCQSRTRTEGLDDPSGVQQAARIERGLDGARLTPARAASAPRWISSHSRRARPIPCSPVTVPPRSSAAR